MLIGALLVLTWVILLVRYPAKALPVSLAALAGLGLVAAWVIWQDNDESRHLQRQELRLSYAPERCPVDRPLAVELKNGSDRPLLELRWRIAAYRPGDSVNLADTSFDSPRYRAPNALLGGDKQLYNSQSIKSLLLGSYAKNRALLGPTAAFVKAGSLASSYSDQEDWLDTLDELLGQAPRHWPLSLYPGHFKVLGNRQVARSLGIDLASDADLGRRLAEGEEP